MSIQPTAIFPNPPVYTCIYSQWEKGNKLLSDISGPQFISFGEKRIGHVEIEHAQSLLPPDIGWQERVRKPTYTSDGRFG